MRVLEGEYLEEYRRIGARRFEEAVTAALRHHVTGFYPSLGEFLKYVPDVEDKSLDAKMAEWRAQYERDKNDPEWQEQYRLLQQKLKQISCTHGGE